VYTVRLINNKILKARIKYRVGEEIAEALVFEAHLGTSEEDTKRLCLKLELKLSRPGLTVHDRRGDAEPIEAVFLKSTRKNR
jgi:hypothetical protein